MTNQSKEEEGSIMEKQIEGYTKEMVNRAIENSYKRGKQEAEKIAIAVCDKCSIRKETLSKVRDIIRTIKGKVVQNDIGEYDKYISAHRLMKKLKSLEQNQTKQGKNTFRKNRANLSVGADLNSSQPKRCLDKPDCNSQSKHIAYKGGK
jgi:hypothetical protein